MASVFEALMLACFGFSWPFNAHKSWKAGTAKATSWQFLALITIGYLLGIAAKFVGGNLNWVLAVYFIDLGLIILNIGIYLRNRKLDKQRAARLEAERN